MTPETRLTYETQLVLKHECKALLMAKYCPRVAAVLCT